MNRLLSKLLTVLALVLAFAAIAAVLPMRKVVGDDMDPTIRAGDWVWIVPVTPLRGDVVALQDPLDPSRTILRRALSAGDTKIKYEDASLRINGKRVRQKEMGVRDDHKVLKETIWSKPPAVATTWLVRRAQEPLKWSHDKVEVPPGHWYLIADNRDDAMDSRHWGPVPEASIQGVVRFRVGPEDAWRPQWEWVQGTE